MIKTYDSTFPQILKFIWYSAEFAITGAKRKSSKEKLYIELSLQTPEKNQFGTGTSVTFSRFSDTIVESTY